MTLSRADHRRRLEILRYVFDPRYQQLPENFGYVEEKRGGRRHWLVVGWKAGFDNSVIRQELSAGLPRSVAQKPDLSPFKNDVGWSFPKASLVDRSPGYWVSGHRMALTHRPRRDQSYHLESTLRALRLTAP